MKASEARKLIGLEVQWEYAHDHHRGTCLVARGVLKEVKGRNVLIDDCGSIDWKWLPQMSNLKPVSK